MRRLLRCQERHEQMRCWYRFRKGATVLVKVSASALGLAPMASAFWGWSRCCSRGRLGHRLWGRIRCRFGHRLWSRRGSWLTRWLKSRRGHQQDICWRHWCRYRDWLRSRRSRRRWGMCWRCWCRYRGRLRSRRGRWQDICWRYWCQHGLAEEVLALGLAPASALESF